MTGRLTRRRYLATLSGAAGVALAGCSGGGGTTVEMTDDLTYEPATLSVAVGDTVTWHNVGTTGHSVTAYGARIPEDAPFFASGGFDAESAARTAYPDGRIIGGDAYEHTFEVAGRYAYFCVPHERAGMRGTIEVG